MMKNLRMKVQGLVKKVGFKIFAAMAGIAIPVLASGTTAAANDVNSKLGFGKEIDPAKLINKAGGVAINTASGIAVISGVVFLIQGIQAFFQARDSHDSQQMMQGFSRLFIGIGLAAAGGIALYFVNMA